MRASRGSGSPGPALQDAEGRGSFRTPVGRNDRRPPRVLRVMALRLDRRLDAPSATVLTLAREPPLSTRRQPLGQDLLQHLDALHRLAHYLARDPDEAADLVQETFARALQGGDGLRRAASLRAWLFQILRNVRRDRWRRSAVREPPGDGAEEGSSTVDPDGLLRGDAELELLRGVVAAEVEAALRRLSEDARAVVLLDLEDLTETEMAEALGCAVGTVKSRLARARAALRRALAEYRR